MPLTAETIELALSSFAQKHPAIKCLGIYGSYAKGTARENSDVDVCLAAERPISTECKIQYINELTLLLKKEVDLLDLQAASGVILKEALHSARWTFREPSVYAQLLKKMMFDQADFQPYYQRILKIKRERFFKS